MVQAGDLTFRGGEAGLGGPFGAERVCGVVAGTTSVEMRAGFLRGLKTTKTLEVRLDYLRSFREIQAFLRWLNHRAGHSTVIATCRRRQAGGFFGGSRQRQLAILAQAVRAGCSWCDVEIETAKHMAPDELHRTLRPARLLISYHNFRRTPSGLPRIVRQLERAGGDAIKIAAQCNFIQDSVKIVGLARGRRTRVAVPMGEMGLSARILAVREGSALAYAAVEQPTAPGQPSLAAMKQLYRAGEITRRTRVYGVIGNPIGHSLSPLLHNTAFRARKLNAVFVPLLVRGLPDFLRAVEAFGIAGFAVTIPHKESILRHLDGCDPLAARIGAVNTVVVRGGGRLYGYNTDYVGALRSLASRVRLAGSRVLLLGAGGAARAAAFALVQAGAVVGICSRRPERARALARATHGQAVARSELRREYFDAVVNCTPVGLHPRDVSPLGRAELHCRIVMDMVYRPRETKLLQMARAQGIETISGVEMFLAQGAAQYEIWTGERAPQPAMRRAVVSALAAEEQLSQGKKGA